MSIVTDCDYCGSISLCHEDGSGGKVCTRCDAEAHEHGHGLGLDDTYEGMNEFDDDGPHDFDESMDGDFELWHGFGWPRHGRGLRGLLAYAAYELRCDGATAPLRLTYYLSRVVPV